MANLIEKIKDKLIEQNLVHSEEDFCCKWLAKNKSYLRVLRYKRLQPSLSSLMICADRLSYYAQRCEDSKHDGLRGMKDVLRQLESECKAAAAVNARQRWQGGAWL